MIQIRDAGEEDAKQIGEVFRASYGSIYPYPEFFDPQSLKKMIFSDETLMIVAEDNDSKSVVGTASVVLKRGAYSDLIGEFGRLAVHPDWRNQGIGRLLMEGRLQRVRDRLHVGIIDARVVHPYTAKIASKNEFSVVGYLPAKMMMQRRENLALMVRYFGGALRLRRNHPRIIPEAFRLAQLSMQNCGLPFDGIVDEDSAPYPYHDGFSLEELTTDGYADLLRIERGRVANREVFGPVRLHYGFFKLTSTNAHYLIAQDGGHLAGAIGYTLDHIDKAARIFEIISPSDNVQRFLLSELAEKCHQEKDILYVEIDASAYAPRMQRTLLELGFLPAAYVPALVFHEVERLDIVKMVKLFTSIEWEEDHYTEEVVPAANLVIESFRAKEIAPEVLEAIDKVGLFAGLNEEQQERIASCCSVEKFAGSQEIFSERSSNDKIYLVLDGEVSIRLGEQQTEIGTICTGECFGEVSVLSSISTGASAFSAAAVQLAVLTKQDLSDLIRLRPDIGVIVYKNLAQSLGRKLTAVDSAYVNDSEFLPKK